MERVFSEEEKIRRAIEISRRRNANYNLRETTRVNVNNKKRDYSLFKRMIFQIIICLCIYIIFYLINTTNYVFSERVLKSTKDILSYDINIENIYKECQKFFVSTFKMQNDNNQTMVLDNTITNTIVNNVDIEKNIIEENKIVINETTNNIKSENKKENEKDSNKKETSKTEMEKDAEKVLKLCKFKKPLNGVITSEFGEREATIQGMTTDHKGIDIAAQSGTNIKAAISGTVSVAEQNSEYGKFIKIANGNVMTVYAHCKELKVKKGDKVKLGQTIATVGSTGNSTGPHLHFEIRLENRYINPQYVIKF